MCPSLTTPGDELPTGRRKLIHPVGVVGRVEWRDRGGHPYTGIFKGGAKHGIVRLGHSLVPRPGKATDTVGNPRPGMGLKLLRDGRDSANVLAVISLSGQQSWNFFEKARDDI